MMVSWQPKKMFHTLSSQIHIKFISMSTSRWLRLVVYLNAHFIYQTHVGKAKVVLATMHLPNIQEPFGLSFNLIPFFHVLLVVNLGFFFGSVKFRAFFGREELDSGKEMANSISNKKLYWTGIVVENMDHVYDFSMFSLISILTK